MLLLRLFTICVSKKFGNNEKANGHDLYLELENNYFKEALDLSNNRLNAPTFVKVDRGIMVKYHLNTTQDHIKMRMVFYHH